jgi:hypothetical protein
MKGIAELQFICENVSKQHTETAVLDLDVTCTRIKLLYRLILRLLPKSYHGSIGGGGRYVVD